MALLHCPLTLACACHLLAPVSCPWQSCHSVPSLCTGPLLVLTLVQFLVHSVPHFGVMSFADPNGICPYSAMSHFPVHPPPSHYTPELSVGCHGWSGVIFPTAPLERVSLECLRWGCQGWGHLAVHLCLRWGGGHLEIPPASAGGHLAVLPCPRRVKGLEGQPRWCWGVQWGAAGGCSACLFGVQWDACSARLWWGAVGCGGVRWGAVGGVQRVRDSSTTRHRIPACLPSPWQPPGNQR